MRKFNLLFVIAFCFLQLNANAENSKTVSVSFDKLPKTIFCNR